MGLLTEKLDFIGLDIGTSSIRLVHLKGTGPLKSIVKYALSPIEPNISVSDSPADMQKLAAAIKDLINQVKPTTNNVAVGLPTTHVFTTVVDMDKLSQSELDKTIKLQADVLIPTAASESKLDWMLLGDSPIDQNKVEILLTSVSNDYVERRLDLLEGIGLNVVAFEPDSLAMARAVIPHDISAPVLVIDMGNVSTDIVISTNGGTRLVRSIPVGTQAFIKAAIQNLNIDEKQAEQFVFKFGLSKDKLEGQIYGAIISTVEVLAGDIEKSIKFYNTRYPKAPLDRIIVVGGASTLPMFPLFLSNKFNINVEIGNAWCNVMFPIDKQNELLAVSSHFSVAAGLAERSA
jgi:type IV pilus assembly protein PilM